MNLKRNKKNDFKNLENENYDEKEILKNKDFDEKEILKMTWLIIWVKFINDIIDQ